MKESEEFLYYPEPEVTLYNYVYDVEGNIMEMVILDSWGDVTVCIYERDAHGNYTKRTTYMLYDREMFEHPYWMNYAEVYEIELREISTSDLIFLIPWNRVTRENRERLYCFICVGELIDRKGREIRNSLPFIWLWNTGHKRFRPIASTHPQRSRQPSGHR